MHEFALIRDLLKKVDQLADQNQAQRVTKVSVKLGALTQITPEHLREHFTLASVGTLAQGATLEVIQETNTLAQCAQDILLDSIEVAS